MSKSTTITYFYSILLFLQDNQFPTANIKSGQTHLYKDIFNCQKPFYTDRLQWKAWRALFYHQRIFPSHVYSHGHSKCTTSPWEEGQGCQYKPRGLKSLKWDLDDKRHFESQTICPLSDGKQGAATWAHDSCKVKPDKNLFDHIFLMRDNIKALTWY